MTRNQTQRLLDAQLHGGDQSLGAADADARAATSHSVWSLSSESTSERREDSTSEPHEEDSLPEDPSSSSLEDPDLDVDGGQAPGGEAYVPSCSWSSPWWVGRACPLAVGASRSPRSSCPTSAALGPGVRCIPAQFHSLCAHCRGSGLSGGGGDPDWQPFGNPDYQLRMQDGEEVTPPSVPRIKPWSVLEYGSDITRCAQLGLRALVGAKARRPRETPLPYLKRTAVTTCHLFYPQLPGREVRHCQQFLKRTPGGAMVNLPNRAFTEGAMDPVLDRLFLSALPDLKMKGESAIAFLFGGLLDRRWGRT
jgi:hypothetical protein